MNPDFPARATAASRVVAGLLAFLLLFAAVAVAAADKTVSDDQIYDNVKRRLANDPQVKGGAFEIDVKNGVVTVRGAVEREKQKERAERLVKKVPGVKSVVNQITFKRK